MQKRDDDDEISFVGNKGRERRTTAKVPKRRRIITAKTSSPTNVLYPECKAESNISVKKYSDKKKAELKKI